MSVREVIVVGGGPAGAAMSLFLRRCGIDVLLVDAARFPRDKVCGEGVSPEAWRLLAAIGADERVAAAQPWPLRGMELTSPGGVCFRGLYAGGARPGFALRRCDLDLALLDTARAAGVEVCEGQRVTELLLEAGLVTGVRITGAGGSLTIRARLVIGADGRDGIVGRQLGLLRHHPSLRRFAVRGYWEGMAELQELGEMHVVRGAYCGIAPLSSTDANVSFVVDEEDMRVAAGDLAGFYEATLRRWPRIVWRLGDARLIGPPRAIGPLALQARALQAPGAIVIGDAAGFLDPFTGEGITLALRTAEIAAPFALSFLRDGDARALIGYERARRAVTRDKFRVNRILLWIVDHPAVADLVARKLCRRPALANRLVGIAGDFVPAGTALDLGFLLRLLAA